MDNENKFKTEDFKTLEKDISKGLYTELSWWQRLGLKIARWWHFNFRNKTLWEGEIGGFKFRLRRHWLDIESIAPNHWKLRIGAGNYAYMYFLSVLGDPSHGDDTLKKHLSFFATGLYMTSHYILSDAKFTKALDREFEWAVRRVEKRAADEAAGVTKAEQDADEVFVEEAVKYGNMSRQQRRKADREMRKDADKI